MSDNDDHYTPKTDPDKERRRTPYSELDLQYMVTEPAWGREATKELNSHVSRIKGQAFYLCDSCKQPYSQYLKKCSICGSEDIKLMVDEEKLWGLLSYYTRDLRLGNLQNKEQTYCLYWLSVAGDCLREGYPKSFLSSLSRVIDILELSQSRQGFYRKRMGTVTSEQFRSELEPKKKNLVTNKKY